MTLSHNRRMMKRRLCRLTFAGVISTGILLSGCEPIKKEPEPESNNGSSSVTAAVSNNQPATSPATGNHATQPVDIQKRKQQFELMQQSLQAIATRPTSTKSADFDYKFVLPSDDWVQTSHGLGDRKASVWLFTSKETGLKIMVSCAGTKEDPAFANSAQLVYDSSMKKNPEVTREWKVGNFTLRRSFIGFIDDRHGEVTITAFSPVCALEFNIASESKDRDEMFKFADSSAEEFMKKNPAGGFPSK